MKKNLALFDFDGTITSKDSLIELIKFHRGSAALIIGFGFHLPSLIAMKVGIVPNWKVKEKILAYFFQGLDVDEFNKICSDFCQIKMKDLIREKALVAIHKHLERDDDVYLVSASAENWLRPWCDTIPMGLICTKLNVKNGKLTGAIDGKNCYGIEKLHRIQAQIDLHSYEKISVYGDSRGDKDMLSIADYKYYKYF